MSVEADWHPHPYEISDDVAAMLLGICKVCEAPHEHAIHREVCVECGATVLPSQIHRRGTAQPVGCHRCQPPVTSLADLLRI